MRWWPWRRRRTRCALLPTDVVEATAARRKAEASLAEAQQRSGEIQSMADRARRYHRVNHFAEMITETFRGGR